jgi:cysteine desulfurase
VARHYLDHASTSPLRPSAAAALGALLTDHGVGDPARVHSEGQTARALVEEARAAVASRFGCRPRSVVFTSGATEAIVAAVWGAVERADGHVVASAVEHSAVRLASAAFGRAVSTVGCDRHGRIDGDEVMDAVRPGVTALVHIQWGNHEVSTLQPVADVVAACRSVGVLVHIDAASAAPSVPIAFDDLGADLLSVSGHKMGGPPGVGALLVRRGLRLRPLLVGGDQERARRAGCENWLGILGWAAAVQEPAEPARLEALSRRIVDGVRSVDGVRLYGPVRPSERLPHIVCLGIDDIEPQAVLLGLDQAGIAVHSGSACASEDLLPSPVLEAMGVDAHRSLRVSVGWNTTDADIDAFLDAFPVVISRLRGLRL